MTESLEDGAATAQWPQPIETAHRDGEWILASSTGLVWFQASRDDEDGWVTFNRYLESDTRQKRAWAPRWWMPVPAVPAPPPAG